MSASFCVINGYNSNNSTKKDYYVSAEAPIKTITVYTWNGYRYNAFGKAELYKYDRGYYIQFVNTTIKLHVNSKYQNGFNSWSVDGWGIYYYYTI